MTIISSHGKFVVVHEILMDNIKNIYIYIYLHVLIVRRRISISYVNKYLGTCVFLVKKFVFCKML